MVPRSGSALSVVGADVTTGALASPGRHRGAEGPDACGPARAHRTQLDRAGVHPVGVLEAQVHLEVVVRQHGGDRVAPLDDRHRAVVEQLGQPQVERLRHLLQPVDVQVVQVQAAGVAADQCERRARDLLVDAEAPTEALRERGLARAQVADQHEQVRRAGELGQGRSQVAGLVHRRGPGDQLRGPLGHDAASPVVPAPASACLARTRSERILAIGSPPPRRTAAGWNVGTSTVPPSGRSR